MVRCGREWASSDGSDISNHDRGVRRVSMHGKQSSFSRPTRPSPRSFRFRFRGMHAFLRCVINSILKRRVEYPRYSNVPPANSAYSRTLSFAPFLSESCFPFLLFPPFFTLREFGSRIMRRNDANEPLGGSLSFL